jgi:UDP-GlcNAc:undecaprenyl-phosphate/decaprenyl-phosphate GlcNAc-1-phosphate transferase
MDTQLPIWQILTFLTLPAALLSFLLCALMRTIAPKIGYVDKPTSRKDHQKPMPYGGGVAIITTFIILILLAVFLIYFDKLSNIGALSWTQIHKAGVSSKLNQMGGILLGAVILSAIGLFDDLKDLGAKTKLIFHFAVAALVVIGFDVRLYLFIDLPYIGYIISIFWIVILINSFNFLDNADGLSAGVAMVCASVLLAVSLAGGQIFVAAMIACLIGALFGFLIHNFPPAKLFMGDAGSTTVGYIIAVSAILTTFYNQDNPQTNKLSVLIPIVVMAIPLYDFFSVLLLRKIEGVNIFQGDNRHFSHRLLRRGLSKRQTVITIYLATGCTAVGAILMRYVGTGPSLLIFIQTLCITAIIGILEYKPKKKD